MKHEKLHAEHAGAESATGGEGKKVESSKSAENPFAKGRERMASIGGFFSRKKEQAIALASRVGGTVSRFWSRTKSFGGEAVAATLSADVLAKKGAQVADEWTSRKAYETGEYLGKKGAEAEEWVKHKGEQVKEFAKDKVELGKDVAFYAKEKTVEGLTKVKDGVKNRYDKIVGFGENAMAAARFEIMKRKDAFREKMNAIRMNRLLEQYGQVEKAESANSERAQRLREQREDLQEKIGLLGALSTQRA
ncbi:MAG: hypothetical protein ABI430_00295 [Candidatus Taylorbacteria bacterium]